MEHNQDNILEELDRVLPETPDQVTKYLMFGQKTQKENIVNATPDLATLAAVITCRLLHTTHTFIFNHFQHTCSRFYM
jgi:hypothetical protein